MTMLTCTNKNCFKTSMDSLLDENINEVICAECGMPILGISEFTKRSMKGMGKIRTQETKSAFVIDCPFCQKKGQPVFVENKVICFSCKKELNLSVPFINTFKDYLKNKKE